MYNLPRQKQHHVWLRLAPYCAIWGALLLNATPTFAQRERPSKTLTSDTETDRARAEQFEAFGKQLSGSRMQGRFSIDGSPGELKEDSYDIESVTKLPNGDLWLFKVRIRYGDHDVNVPLPLTVSWAGTTPVIVVDQLTIPGLGTFDARVVINGQRYAGTWQHGDVGGHLFGTIVPNKAESEETAADTEESVDN